MHQLFGASKKALASNGTHKRQGPEEDDEFDNRPYKKRHAEITRFCKMLFFHVTGAQTALHAHIRCSYAMWVMSGCSCRQEYSELKDPCAGHAI